MSRRFVDHTAELELHLEGPTAEAVFAEAAEALGELLESPGRGRRLRRAVVLEASDRATLLADWLQELLEVADAEGFVTAAAVSVDLEGPRLRATVEGREGRPRPLVKAVTYHGLELEHDADRWRARVVLDV